MGRLSDVRNETGDEPVIYNQRVTPENMKWYLSLGGWPSARSPVGKQQRTLARFGANQARRQLLKKCQYRTEL
jgi:hypothetical protein